MKRGIWNKAALILFLLADFISLSLTVLKVRSILADEAFTPITSLSMGASAGNVVLRECAVFIQFPVLQWTE
jgi:hypothetical protein